MHAGGTHCPRETHTTAILVTALHVVATHAGCMSPSPCRDACLRLALSAMRRWPSATAAATVVVAAADDPCHAQHRLLYHHHTHLSLLKQALAIVEVGVCTLWSILPVCLVAGLQNLPQEVHCCLKITVP